MIQRKNDNLTAVYSMVVKAALLIVLSLILISCSSQPRYIASPMVAEADNLYRIGKKFNSQEQYDNALRSFELALDRYSLVDNIEGMVLSRIAIIGTITKSGKDLPVSDKIEDLEFFVENIAPQFRPNLVLLKTEIAYMLGDLQRVDELTERFSCKNVVLESQILAYRLMSRLERGLSTGSVYRSLRKNARPLKKAYRKRKIDEIGIYSYVNYVMGYYQLNLERWDQAIEYFETSLEVDRQIDNVNGVAQNLYHIGIVYERSDNPEQAVLYFERAVKIFESLGNSVRADLIKRKIARLVKE